MSSSAYTTIVNVSPDTAQNLAEFVCTLVAQRKPEVGRSLYSECQSLIQGLETETLLIKLIEQTDAILTADKESDAEGCFQAMVPIMFTLADEGSRSRVVMASTDALSSNTASKCKLRLHILSSLFNLVVGAQDKYILLLAILTYALKSNQSSAISKIPSRVPSWLDSWSLSPPQRRSLYCAAADLIAANEKESSLALSFRIKYLETYASSGEAYPEEAQAVALSAVLTGISSAASSHADRAAILSALSSSGNISPTMDTLVALLRILCQGSMDDYLSFADKHGDVMRGAGVSPAAVERSMRLLTLASLAATSSVLSYTSIATALGIDRADAEEWVVAAVCSGLIDATIDELSECVVVGKVGRRSFGGEQWGALAGRLQTWRKSVSALIEAADRHN